MTRLTQKIMGKMPYIISTHILYPPQYLNIAITNKCNLSCVMCFRNFLKYTRREMDYRTFKEILEQLPHIRHVNFCGVGEPLLHPEFFEMLSLVRKTTHATISFSTNGTLFDEENIENLVQLKVDKISVSIDGTNGTYQKIRGASFDSLESKLTLFNDVKEKLSSEKPMLEVEFVCMKQNIQTLLSLVSCVKTLKCKSLYLLHPFCLSQEFFQEQHLHSSIDDDYISLILEKTASLCRESGIHLRDRGLEPKPILCYEPWYQITVAEDGTIRPCCFMGTLYSQFDEYYFDSSLPCDPEEFVLGDGNGCSVNKVWKGDEYSALRRNLLKLRKEEGNGFTKQSYADLRIASRNSSYCTACQFRFQTAC